MLYEYQKSSDSIPLDTIAVSMCECDQPNLDFAHSLQVLKSMIEEGSRFANLERVLGQGAVFVMCHPGSDALGTKLLPKGGKRFNEVVGVLRDAGVHTLAEEYAELRHSVISWYHDHVLTKDLQSDLGRTPLPSSVYTEVERADLLDKHFDQDPCLAPAPPSLFDLSSDD
ncbi:uncharacterized protein LTR77_009271 [Saxophila tyrrhenica]|uniref:Uncharacterized protein n=1 Tax=Saxophila tyrrhenica TaxID=1690608 RepID=A0AAV9P2I3_9PEZI|nr:hypothetical protein LTR77_009271 [Saxophila tyrrhenica]